MATHVKIASVLVGSGGSASMAFSSIPATFSDLIIYASARNTYAGVADDILISFNGDANRSSRYLYGTGAAVSSVSVGAGIGLINSANSTASCFAVVKIQITQYAGSNYKSITAESLTTNDSDGTQYQTLASGIWSNTAAITSISLTPNSGTFVEFSSADLYGIKNS
jgi:hypothetical protein